MIETLGRVGTYASVRRRLPLSADPPRLIIHCLVQNPLRYLKDLFRSCSFLVL